MRYLILFNSKGTNIFEAVTKMVSDYGGFHKCFCVVTDEAWAMR